ncbi:MAG: sugar ABC transporter ATP-binding protein [Xanthobacteraceae bacterium]
MAVPRGHIRAILGENGAGKSTLIKMLCGVYATNDGEILLEGRRVSNLAPASALQAGVVAIYQEFNLVPQLTVAQNIFLGRLPTHWGRIDRAALRRQSRAILDRLGIPIDANAPVASLNVAEQQIVEIAKALSYDLRVLVMDEPTAALKDAEIAALFSVIRSLRNDGVCVLYISHRISEILSLADSVSVLKDGQLVGTRDVSEVDRDTLVRMMIGRELASYYPAKNPHSDEVVLAAKGLHLRNALDVERLEIRRGEIVAIAGLEGQGQRPLVRSLCGAVPLDAGEIWLDGERLDLTSPGATIAASVGFIPDDRKGEGLALVRSCSENIALESLDQRRWGGMFVHERKERAFVDKMIEALRIKVASPLQRALDLSGGNQQKLVLAKVLGIGPRILIMAEPTRGIDVGAKREIYNIMRDLTARGVGILMSSGELPEIVGMADRVLVMSRGRIAAELAGGAISEENIMHAATQETVATSVKP